MLEIVTGDILRRRLSGAASPGNVRRRRYHLFGTW